MSWGAGHVMDMLVRLKNNELARSYGSGKYLKTKILYKDISRRKGIFDYKKATPEQLAAVRARLRKYNRRQRRIQWVILIALLLIFALVLTLIFS